MASKKIIFSEE
jgi:hypothetical protein